LIAADEGNSNRFPTRASDPIVSFRRIQFTPDMLPGDVLGVNVFDPKTGRFSFMHGPVFAHIVLADEINRTGPKVQAAFLECMAEKQVTMDNVTHPLDQLFFVLGTQNPLDIAGTYPLPQVQLDRFLLKVPMSYVDSTTECGILENHNAIKEGSSSPKPVCSRSDILAAREICERVHVAQPLREAMVEIVQSTRGNPLIQFGASTRAALMLQTATRAWALISGRDHATEDDLRAIAPYVLLHRLRFHAGAGEAKAALETLMQPAMEKLVRRGLQR
jgi:MoxR-like ATPase